ncbi:DNA polymerase zeta subunit 1 [Carabus blaptoides fortunei]
MTSVKIVTVDYYLSYPVKDLDVCYSEFRGTEVRQVPVLQIFGSTPDGTKTCLHIHGVLPYIYIPYDGVEPAARLSYQLAAEIDRTLNVSLGQASANTCFVHNILLVSGIPLYGYHEREHQYFKIFFYNPMIVKKACSLLENGVILGKHFQPHESHINYVLQFMIDYNLQGMNYIQLSRVMYRIDTDNPRALDAIPTEQILPATVQRRSFAWLECDAMARDIVNIEEVSSGQLAVNPGLAALWDDERQRRRLNELDSQISFCLTQDRAAPKSTASHRVFKQKLRDKLAQPTALSDGSSELERSVYPAETPVEVTLLNASVVLSNNETSASGRRAVLSDALTTPSNETNASSAAETTTSSAADMSVLHLLQDLKANADATVLEDNLIESSQQEHDVNVFKLLQELREGANVEEDSILSQTLVQEDQPSSEDEQNLSLPMGQVSETAQRTELDDDDSVWENSYWDENCEIPQMDGQCDSSSTNTTDSSSSDSSDDDDDEMDNIIPFTPDIGQAVQVADKHYTLHIEDFSVSDSGDWDDSPEQDRDLQITDNDTEVQVTLRKANEVYLGQNHRGTLTNSQLLTPGINILKPITPRRISARDRKKIDISEVIINPGLNVSVSRLATDLCTVQIARNTRMASLPGNSTNDRTMESETNSNPLPSNNSWKRNFTAAMFTDALSTPSVHDSEQSSKDTEPAAPGTGRRKRRRKYSSFTKSQKAPAQTKSFPYRYKKPVLMETYDLRSKVETCFTCPTEKPQRSLGDTCTECVRKRKRKYRKKVVKTGNTGRKAKVAQESTTLELVKNDNRATFDTVQAINSPGPVENTAANQTCEEKITVDLSKSSASSSCAMRMKRERAAQCEHRIRRIQELENNGGSAPVKRNRQSCKSRRIAEIRALQYKLMMLERAMSRVDGTSDRMRLAMRFKRLQREHSEQNDGSTQYYCEMVDGNCRNNRANAGQVAENRRRAQNNMFAGKNPVQSTTSKHKLGALVMNVISIAGTAETIAASDNMSSVPVNNARDDCIIYEVTHSANCSSNSRAHTAVAPVELSSSVTDKTLSTSASQLHTDAADENTPGVSEAFVAEQTSPPAKAPMRRTLRTRRCKICDNCKPATQRNSSNTCRKLKHMDESGTAQNELAIRIRAIQQPPGISAMNKEIQPAPDIVDKKFMRWNVDGANDTLSSSDSSLPEQHLSMVTRRRKQTGKSNKSSDKPGETVKVSSDSAMDKLVQSIQKQTRNTSKQLRARQQLDSPKAVATQPLNSSQLLTKQLQVNLVPLEFLTTTSNMKQQLDRTTTDASNNCNYGNTPYKSKLKPTRTSPRFRTLAVTIHSPKSKRNAKQTAEPDLKRTKIARNLKKHQDSSGKDDTMDSDRNGRSGELQMFGIVPIIQNSNTDKKPPSRSLNSNTTCDTVNQTNSVPTNSIISEPSQCDKTRINVKKQLFTNKPPLPPPPRKTIIVNINTDTNTTFVEEQKVCAYEKSRRNSVEPKFVQIQRLKDLIAKEEKDAFPAERDTGKMADDTFNFQRPAAVPPSDIFQQTPDDPSTTDTSDLFSDANSAANLKYFVEHTLARQHRDVTSTSRDIYSAPIAFNDQPVRKTRLDTPYVNSDFSSYDNNVVQYERTPENPPRQHEEEQEEEEWFPLICYEDEDELTTAQLYDLKCGFVPQPGPSTQETSYVRCARLHYNNEYYEAYDHEAEQAAIMQSLLEQHAKKQAELAEMQYDPDCDGEPLVEEPEDSSLSFEPNRESIIDSDTLVSSTDDDSLVVNNTSCTIKEIDMDEFETCDDIQSNCNQSDKCEHDQSEITNSVQSSEVNGDISNEEKDDVIIEDTPPKSSIQIFTLLHTTSIPNEIKTRMLMPKYHAPTRHDIMSTLAEYNIPECRHQEPFYSNAADVTGKMDVGHNVLKIPSNTIQDLEEFKSCTGFPGLDAWRREKFKQLYPDVDVSKINFRIAFAGQSKVVMVPGAEPPTRQQAEQWVEDKRQAAASAKETPPIIIPRPKMVIPLSPSGDMDDSMSETMTLSPCTPIQEDSQTNSASLTQRKASGNLQRRALFSQTAKPVLNLSDSSVHNNSHQITGVNVDSNVDLQNLQHAKALTEPQNLTIMVVELYIRTRGDLYPNPQYDAVRAIFYSILNDMPAGAVLPREETGVLVVNTLDDGSHSNLLDGSGVTCSVVYVQSETELMSTFVQLVRKWDPDICAGYEIEMHSWGYLIERGNVLSVNLTSELSRINPAVVKKRPANADSDEKDIQLTGRIILDVWRLLRHEVALQSYTFENTMYHILHRRVPKFSYQRLTFYWECKRNFYRHITAKYYILRVQSVLRMLDQLDLIGRTSELAKLFGIQFYEVLSRGSQFRVESMMLRLAKPLNYIPISPSVTQRAKMRAPEFLPLIFEPESRFYADPVIVLDFQSLYPSIIIAYNYCFSTCIGRVELLGTNQPFEFGACQLKVPRETLRNLDHKINFSPCGVGFVKPEVRQGILPRMLKEILETRLMVKSSMKENRDNKLLQRVLHSRQLGLKLIANVTYGYTAANFSGRMPCIEVGDSVVSKGRETLERAIKLIEQTPKWRAKVVYGDTDSVFVMVAGRSKAEAFRIGAEIAEAVTNDNPAPVKLKLEKVFLPCILQTKKRYVGYMYESVDQVVPEYCAKGIETVRRDGCPAVAKMLENTLRTLFETRDMSLVKRYVCRQFSKLLTGRVSIQDLTFAREYRGASGYRPGACVPALTLARKWAVTDKRREPRRGERVPYVIVNGPPGLPLIRLVRCPRELLADPSRLRPNAVYYITRVIAPALNRCFTLIGADVLTWYNEMPRRQLQQLPTEDSSNVKKSTISQYFATTSCAVCGQQSRDGLCETCSKDPQQSVVVLYMKINNWERSYDEVSLICESCCGRKTDCNSLDCPVLYRLNQLRRDLRQVPYVRKQIGKFTDE